MPALRLFVALDPPELVRRRVAALRKDLERGAGRAAGEVKWVAAENVHLTLQFLGAVPEERLADVEAAVSAAAVLVPPFHLEVHGTGGFPNGRRPRVLWAGVGGELAPLQALVSEVGRRLAPLGFTPEERAFSPHLTLGRARDSRGVPGLAATLALGGDAPGARWPVTDVVLFRSHLSPKGPTYEALLRAPLGGAA